MKLWSGRVSGEMDANMAALNNSLPFDKRLAPYDVLGSQVWARALARAGVLTQEEAEQISRGLGTIQEEFSAGTFVFKESDEDIHTAVERRLTELTGPLAGKLHTGRSRNDQVATDFRMWVLAAAERLKIALEELQQALVERAESDAGIILPGYTHFQQAQPVLISHWWLSHFWALQRDMERLNQLVGRTQTLPLGCGALAGTAFPIDRFALAEDLGFSEPSPNSLDAISDRDFAADFLYWAAMVGVHLSRMAEALVLFSTSEFGFIELSDAFSTGSSLMPQKKNPDPMELARAKSGILTGKLTSLLVILKGLPSAYDKDLQEDKPLVFDASDTLEVLLPVMSGAIATLTVRSERTRAAIGWAVLATDVADYLVRRGVPFRTAHSATGKAVRRAEELGVPLPELPLPEWQGIHPAFDAQVVEVFNVDKALERRAAWGGTAPQAVAEQLAFAREVLGDRH